MSSVKRLSILGSTGSIGRSTLEVVRARPGRFRVEALAAGNNINLLAGQIEEFGPSYVSVLDEAGALELKRRYGDRLEVGHGIEGASRAASLEGVDMVVAAISGAAGLLPTMAAIEAGKDIALANKETMVAAGPLVTERARETGSRILPVDSEHSALFQSLAGHRKEDVRRVILTASGGPFFGKRDLDLNAVTPEEALDHPRWSMGRKVTVDSATLMNKGLEVIEASMLFDLPPGRISVIIHPQSIVHSMVEYIDGSIISQMGTADMKGPIAYALGYPERLDGSIRSLSLDGLALEFHEPDMDEFPCLGLAYAALRLGGTAPAVLNAADEVAVESFLAGKIKFTDIYRIIDGVLSSCTSRKITSMEDVLEADRGAREEARGLVAAKG